ncbi:hypothetical protein BH24ACI5_BH24ACI5_24550 [soil metagenome]
MRTEYHFAVIATGVTLLVLILLNPVERWIDRRVPRPPEPEDLNGGSLPRGFVGPAVEAPAGQPRPTQP